MKQHHWFFAWLCTLLCVLTLSLNSHATVTDPLITIDIETPVHFLAPDGSPLIAEPGTYTAESAEEWLSLVPGERHNALLIETKKGTHQLELPDALALSVGGTEEDHKDLHHVILLLPNGQSLESTGSYSGIRPRGFFGNAINNVKKQANRAYKKARSTAKKTISKTKSTTKRARKQVQKSARQGIAQAKKGTQNIRKGTQQAVKQAGSQARKGIQTARNAALQAKRQIERTTKHVASKVKQGMQSGVKAVTNKQFVARLQSEIQTLQAVRKLRLEPLFGCLAKASGQATGNVGQMVQRLVSNPAGFGNWIFQDLMRQWERNFSEVMNEQLQIISNPSRSRIQGPQAVDMAFRSLETLAQKGPGGRCLMQFVRPHLKAIRNMSGELQRTTMDQGKRIFDSKVAPILYGGLNKQIGAMIRAAMSLTPKDIAQSRVRSRGIDPMDGWQGEVIFPKDEVVSRGFSKNDATSLLKEIVPGFKDIIAAKDAVLAYQLLNPRELYSAASKVELLTRSLDNQAQRRQALNDVRRVLDPTAPWNESLYIDIGMEILRAVGRNYINSELPGGGSYLIRSAVEVLDFGEQTVGTVVQSAAGLVPEVGGVVSGVAKITPDIIWKMTINNIIVGTVKGGVHYVFGKIIDEGKKALKAGQSYEVIKRHAGPLSALLRYMPSKQQIMLIATTHTEDTRKALERYNRSVLMLAESAAQ